ncbi:MAG TPA: adenylate/guanylate cyclase domain-containing protein [Gaiellaceae bacterium]|nr:adenylate/guanylate cyclase domain-containing protein [Gaiellaceae bacterium]
MTQLAGNPLDAGREAARRHAWREAYDLFRSADETGALAAEDLQSLAEAAWWTGRLDEAIDLRERAYAVAAETGEPRRAAMLALALTQDHGLRGSLNVAGGWLARAERLLSQEPEGPEHAHLALVEGMVALDLGELARAGERFVRARELTVRYGDRNLETLALVFEGALLVSTGEVKEGLGLLDEATAAATSGELDPLSTGIVYCVTIGSCQALGDCGRASEWTEAANRWCDRLDVDGFPGTCRVHRAEILRLSGDWPRAEKQAVQACEELHDYNRPVTAAGFYEIGEIRRRQGDFAAAEQAYRRADELGRDPQPGLALLRLAQGKVEAAAAGIRRALADERLDPLARSRRLPAQVEIALTTGAIARARETAEELEAIADRYRAGASRTPAFEGAVQLAWGRIRLAEHNWEDAIVALRAARETWTSVGAPYETAQARLLLGLAYRGDGDEDGAREELIAAKATFERLGAVLDLQRAADLLGVASTARRTFVFTDIVESTKLVEALGDDKWRKLLSWHDRTLREQIEQAGGEVIKQTGDGYFAAFATPEAAVEAAAAIQRALEAHEPVAPDVRIGVHTGGAFHRDGNDYAGQGVHMAARIGALARGGEILASSESLEGGSRFALSAPRSETLKGFDDAVELVSVEWR